MRLFCFPIVAFLAAASFTFAPGALAGEGCGDFSVVEHIFDAADEDQSGSLTASEYEAAALERFGMRFDESDLDGDGVTTLDEYLDLYDMHHPPNAGNEV